MLQNAAASCIFTGIEKFLPLQQHRSTADSAVDCIYSEWVQYIILQNFLAIEFKSFLRMHVPTFFTYLPTFYVPTFYVPTYLFTYLPTYLPICQHSETDDKVFHPTLHLPSRAPNVPDVHSQKVWRQIQIWICLKMSITFFQDIHSSGFLNIQFDLFSFLRSTRKVNIFSDAFG